MSVTMFVLLIVAGVLVVAGLVVGLVFFILLLVKSLGGTTGGWQRLAEVYGTANPPTGQITKRETIQVGAVNHKRCVTLGVASTFLIAFSYRATVPTKKDEWMEVRLPLDKFEATSFGRPVRDAGAVDPKEVNALGFLLGDKKAGPFKLEVEWIKVERTAN